MILWWHHPDPPEIPETPEPVDRSDELAALRVRVKHQRARSWRSMLATERTVEENCFGPKFATALRESPR